MNRSKLFLKIIFPLLAICNLVDCYAEVTGISNSLLAANFSRAQTMPIFRSRANLIRVSGPWLDTTNDIDAEGLSGQPNFGISITRKAGGQDPYVEFTLNSDRPGRYRVRLKRPGGEDVITIEYTDHISIASTEVLTISNATPAYLSAYPINTDTRLRITGTNVNRITFKPISAPNFYTATNSTIGNATVSQKDIKFSFTVRRDKVDIQQRDFIFTVAGRDFDYSQYKGNQAWNVNNLPFFRAYDKPDFIVKDEVSGIYNRKQGTCLAISANNSNVMIENPERCVNEFRIPNPSGPGIRVEQIVTLADIRFTIINDSYAPQFTPITVQVKFGLNIRATLTIDKMVAKQEKVIVFHRPESRKKLVRHGDCRECFELLESPFNWSDDEYTVVVDPTNLIPEINDGIVSNSRTFAGTTTLP